MKRKTYILLLMAAAFIGCAAAIRAQTMMIIPKTVSPKMSQAALGGFAADGLNSIGERLQLSATTHQSQRSEPGRSGTLNLLTGFNGTQASTAMFVNVALLSLLVLVTPATNRRDVFRIKSPKI